MNYKHTQNKYSRYLVSKLEKGEDFTKEHLREHPVGQDDHKLNQAIKESQQIIGRQKAATLIGKNAPKNQSFQIGTRFRQVLHGLTVLWNQNLLSAILSGWPINIRIFFGLMTVTSWSSIREH